MTIATSIPNVIHDRAKLHNRPQIFEHFVQACEKLPPMTVAVCSPSSAVALAGAVEAFEARLIHAIFVGDEKQIHLVAQQLGVDLRPFRLINARDEVEAAARSVELCRIGEAAALMKGSLHTDLLMRAVVDKECGLCRSRRVSHVFVLDAPNVFPRALDFRRGDQCSSDAGRQD